MDDAEAGLRLAASISGLADRVPEVSVRTLIPVGQRRVFLLLFVAAIAGLVVAPVTTLMAIAGVVTVVYAICIVYRTYLFVRSNRSGVAEVVTDADARSVSDAELPTYTVLVPAYREPEVINRIVANVCSLEYPREKLEVLVLVEADDDETIDAIKEGDAEAHFRLVLVPPAEPRTKPKALNFGLTLARGDLVAVFDVEDEPERLQLRRAAVALNRLGPEVACVQAKLSYNNPDQNMITRWFTIEYAMWFTFFLPGLASLDAPIPLGGTSNHFRRSALRALGGWDPFNVTEDADLGIRMNREKMKIRVLESTTLEEANSDFVNWVKQRSRWYKGYLQTFFVHMRSPRELRREIGTRGVLHFCVFVGGTPLLAVLNPVFWLLALVWFVAHPLLILRIFPAPVYYLGMLCWAMGNFLLAYLTLLSCRVARSGELLLAALTVPVYWVMMSLAAIKALWQLVARPTLWEKTTHGLHKDRPVEHAAALSSTGARH